MRHCSCSGLRINRVIGQMSWQLTINIILMRGLVCYSITTTAVRLSAALQTVIITRSRILTFLCARICRLLSKSVTFSQRRGSESAIVIFFRGLLFQKLWYIEMCLRSQVECNPFVWYPCAKYLIDFIEGVQRNLAKNILSSLSSLTSVDRKNCRVEYGNLGTEKVASNLLFSKWLSVI